MDKLQRDFNDIGALLISKGTPPHVLADIYKHLSTLLYATKQPIDKDTVSEPTLRLNLDTEFSESEEEVEKEPIAKTKLVYGEVKDLLIAVK